MSQNPQLSKDDRRLNKLESKLRTFQRQQQLTNDMIIAKLNAMEATMIENNMTVKKATMSQSGAEAKAAVANLLTSTTGEKGLSKFAQKYLTRLNQQPVSTKPKAS
jgi:hypothetical protein